MRSTAENNKVAASLRELLVGVVDYAGLFPPASLSMQKATANYASYRASQHAWMLGRYVVSAARLQELSATAGVGEHRGEWHISALVADPAREMPAIADFNARHEGRLVVDAVELKAASSTAVSQDSALIPRSITSYFEIEPAKAPVLLPAIAAAGARAKIRTGGVAAEMFPSSAVIAGSILDCCKARVAFKATAGLHHPIRCVRPLTYEANAPTGLMHGFLNVFVAATLAQAGAARDELVAVLAVEDVTEFEFADDHIAWGRIRVTAAQVRNARECLAVSFGSCSFVEPVADLQQLRLL